MTQTTAEPASLVDRSVELTDEVLASMEHLQRTAIGAVRLVLDTVDEMLPAQSRPSSRETAINAVMDVTDTVVTAQYELLRTGVRTLRR